MVSGRKFSSTTSDTRINSRRISFPFSTLEIQHQALLVPVQADEISAAVLVVSSDERAELPRIVSVFFLDVDHLGAQVRQNHAGGRGRQDMAEIHNANTFQGSWHGVVLRCARPHPVTRHGVNSEASGVPAHASRTTAVRVAIIMHRPPPTVNTPLRQQVRLYAKKDRRRFRARLTNDFGARHCRTRREPVGSYRKGACGRACRSCRPHTGIDREDRPGPLLPAP